MKFIWENNSFFIPVSMFFGFCGMLALLVPYSNEIVFFNELRREPFNSIFQFLSHCGEAWAYLVFGLAVVFWKPKYALLIALVGLLALPLVYTIKDLAAVDRPITFFEKRTATAQLVLVPDAELNRGQTSFPSGHSMAAFALYSLLALMLGKRYEKWGLGLALLAISVGVSRIFLVQHFLVDVLAGAFLGLLLSGVCWRVALPYLKPVKA